MEANYPRGKVPLGRFGGRNITAMSTHFISLGPFPGYGHCVGFGYQLGTVTAVSVRLGVVIAYVAEESAGAFNSGGSLLLPTGLTIERQPGILVQSIAGGSVVQPLIPLFVPVDTGSAYVVFAVQNTSGLNFRFSCWALFGHVLDQEGAGGSRTQ